MKYTGETALNAYSIAATTPLSFGMHPGSRETQTPQKRKARILVVDDDPGLLRLLTIRLRAENYEVEAVESAAAALAASRSAMALRSALRLPTARIAST